MSNFITGLFTLLAALGGIYLKDYLEQKSIHKKSSRQRAVEAYALINKIPYSLIYLVVLCKNAVNDTKTDSYVKSMVEFNEKTPDLLEAVELIIIENFTNLQGDLLPIQQNIVGLRSFLIENISKPLSSDKEVDKRWKEFSANILRSTSDLNSKLLTQYINVKPPKRNFYLLKNKIWSNLVSFFSKPEI